MGESAKKKGDDVEGPTEDSPASFDVFLHGPKFDSLMTQFWTRFVKGNRAARPTVAPGPKTYCGLTGSTFGRPAVVNPALFFFWLIPYS